MQNKFNIKNFTKLKNEKIIKYTGAGILGVILASGIGLAINEATTNHTEKLCLTTRIMNSFGKEKNGVPEGIATHQIPKMQEELKKQGITDAVIKYEKAGEYIDSEELVLYPETVNKNDGSKAYIIPASVLEDIGFKTSYDEEGKLKLEKNIVRGSRVLQEDTITSYWDFSSKQGGEKITPKEEAVLVLKK